MNKIKRILGYLIAVFILASSFITMPRCSDCNKATFLDSIKNDSVRVDSVANYSLKLYKNNVHASYYHNKFNGRKTASGEKFDNNKYTAAHRKFKFGTKLLITNPKNNKSVIVTVNDRGPFVKGREIDLSKKAFMEISHNTSRGFIDVNIEIIEE